MSVVIREGKVGEYARHRSLYSGGREYMKEPEYSDILRIGKLQSYKVTPERTSPKPLTPGDGNDGQAGEQRNGCKRGAEV